MPTLQTLREARSIIRWMLVWFALSIGVAVAAPVVNPQALTLICTTAGTLKFVTDAADDSAPGTLSGAHTHTLDCVMCLPTAAPPGDGWMGAPLATALSPLPAAPPDVVASLWADTANARGPPSQT